MSLVHPATVPTTSAGIVMVMLTALVVVTGRQEKGKKQLT
jgi:hypothetical protein